MFNSSGWFQQAALLSNENHCSGDSLHPVPSCPSLPNSLSVYPVSTFSKMAAISTASLLEEEVSRLRVFYDSVMQQGRSQLRTKPGDVLLPGAYEK